MDTEHLFAPLSMLSKSLLFRGSLSFLCSVLCRTGWMCGGTYHLSPFSASFDDLRLALGSTQTIHTPPSFDRSETDDNH